MKLLYVDINIHWWQAGVLGLKGEALIAYAFIWQQTFDFPMEDSLDDVDIMFKLGLATPEDAKEILLPLMKRDLVAKDKYDRYYAVKLSPEVSKAIRDEENLED